MLLSEAKEKEYTYRKLCHIADSRLGVGPIWLLQHCERRRAGTWPWQVPAEPTMPRLNSPVLGFKPDSRVEAPGCRLLEVRPPSEARRASGSLLGRKETDALPKLRNSFGHVFHVATSVRQNLRTILFPCSPHILVICSGVTSSREYPSSLFK